MVAARKKATTAKSKEENVNENKQQDDNDKDSGFVENKMEDEPTKDSHDNDNKVEESGFDSESKVQEKAEEDGKTDKDNNDDGPTGWDVDLDDNNDAKVEQPSVDNWNADDSGFNANEEQTSEWGAAKNTDYEATDSGYESGGNYSSRDRSGGFRDRGDKPYGRDRRGDDFSRGPKRFDSNDSYDRKPSYDDYNSRRPSQDDYNSRRPPQDDFSSRRQYNNDYSQQRPQHDDYNSRRPPQDDYDSRRPSYRFSSPYPPRDVYPQKRYGSPDHYDRSNSGYREEKRPRYESRSPYGAPGEERSGFDSRQQPPYQDNSGYQSRDRYPRDRDDRRPSSNYDNNRYEDGGYERSKPYDPSNRGPKRDGDRPPRPKKVIPAEVPPSRALGIFGLSIYASEDDLREFLDDKLPDIKDYKITVIQDRNTGISRGYGFVYFQSIEESIKAKDRLIGAAIKGKEIRVDFSISDALRPNYH